MVKINADLIRKLRDSTGAPVMRVKAVLDEVRDEKKAEKILKKEGFEKAKKREGKETSQGKLFTYLHHSGKVSSIVELFCETDFVARNELFSKLGTDLSMQIASMNPKDTKELLSQDFIKDPSVKISDLFSDVIAKTGENIRIGRIFRVELGN